MAYRISVVDIVERLALIGARTAAATEQRVEYKFRNGKEPLKLIHVPLALLVYRLENYRTRDIQLSKIAKREFPPGFFDSARHQDVSVQDAQHTILLAEARRGSGETIKPVYNELQRVRRQTEDLIITHEGVVVNGNRRLSAMRDLYAMDSEAYQDFAEIWCAVLPPTATAEEIRELEIALQMQPDTKLPYEWTALGRAARDLRQDGKSDEEIARQMNRDKKDILRAIAKVDTANLYLTEWLNMPDDFTLLDETEQAFNQIAVKNTTATKDVSVREATRAFDFFLVEQRETLQDRAYVFINSIEDHPETFLHQMAEELDVQLPTRPVKNDAEQHVIQFDDEIPEETDYEPLLQKLKEARADDALTKETSLAIQSVCLAVAEQGRNQGQLAKKLISEALRKLSNVDLTTASADTYQEIRLKLAALTSRAEHLQDDMEGLLSKAKR